MDAKVLTPLKQKISNFDQFECDLHRKKLDLL